MSKSKISPKTQKLLLGLVLLAVVAVIVFFFPELLPTGDDVFKTVPSDSTAASPTTPASTTKAAPPDTTESPETTKVSETTKATETTKAADVTTAPETERKLDRNGSYTSRDDVALYIHQYGKLPGNFITKAEAQKLKGFGNDLEINRTTGEVVCRGEIIDLTSRERSLLLYLDSRRGSPVSREDAIRDVWGFEFTGETNVVDVYIRYIRKKLDERFDAKFIVAVRGKGYMLR